MRGWGQGQGRVGEGAGTGRGGVGGGDWEGWSERVGTSSTQLSYSLSSDECCITSSSSFSLT